MWKLKIMLPYRMFSRWFLLLDVSRICRENVFSLNQALISRSTRVSLRSTRIERLSSRWKWQRLANKKWRRSSINPLPCVHQTLRKEKFVNNNFAKLRIVRHVWAANGNPFPALSIHDTIDSRFIVSKALFATKVASAAVCRFRRRTAPFHLSSFTGVTHRCIVNTLSFRV